MKEVPEKIKYNLDEGIKYLKNYKNELPSNLYTLTSRDVFHLKRMLAIIEGLEIPEKITTKA